MADQHLRWDETGGRELNEDQPALTAALVFDPEASSAEDSGTRTRQFVSEFGGTVAAGIAGAITWGLSSHPRARILRPLLTSMAAGAVTKVTVKSCLESLLLSPEDRTTSKKDLAWGAVDGLAGMTASAAERKVASQFTRQLGTRYLGHGISRSVAQMGGEKVLAQSLLHHFQLNLYRGVVGGATGAFTYSIPHAVHDNWQYLRTTPYTGINRVSSQILLDTAMGTAFGGVLSVGMTGIFRSPQIIGRGLSSMRGGSQVTRLDISHINDLHSELIGARGLPRIATKLNELRDQSLARGHTHHFYGAGDMESGNAVFAFTKGGLVENEALGRMRLSALIPGNHPYDAAGGGVNVQRYIDMMSGVQQRHRIPLLAANLEFPNHPDYARMVRPYVIHEVATPSGPSKVAVLGLITQEGAVDGIKFLDPEQIAVKYIGELHEKGVQNIVVLSHLGLSDDIKLAQNVRGISAIVGGHSHDFEPVPRWIRQGSNQPLLSRIRQAIPVLADPDAGWDVPIVQAGSNGRWLGELKLAFSPSGAADRLRTTGRLHPISTKIPADRGIESYIDSHLTEIARLRSIEYGAEATGVYSLGNIRNRETPLGNLVSDAVYDQLNNRLGAGSVDVVLTNSGGIRAGINAYEPLNRFELSHIFMNSGKVQNEAKDLILLQMSGREIKEALEYGVHDFPTYDTSQLSLATRLSQMFRSGRPGKYAAESGNLLQVSGLKYSFDLANQSHLPGDASTARVSNVMVKGRFVNNFVPVNDDGIYTVATRMHALERWQQHGIFGDLSLSEVQKHVRLRKLGISSVELLGDHIRGRKLSPYAPSAGGIAGRINNLTAPDWKANLTPGISIPGYATVAGTKARPER